MQLASYGKIDGSGEQAMQNEILQRGPITCSIATDSSFVYKYRHGVYKGPNATDVDHDIEVLHLLFSCPQPFPEGFSCILNTQPLLQGLQP